MKKRGLALFLAFCLSVGSIISSVGTEQAYAAESNQTEGTVLEEQEKDDGNLDIQKMGIDEIEEIGTAENMVGGESETEQEIAETEKVEELDDVVGTTESTENVTETETAETGDETETEIVEETDFAMAGNDGFEKAASVSVNTSVSGALASSNDEKYYKFTLSQAGYVSVNFKHEPVNSTNELWSIRLYNAQYQELVYRTSTGKNIIRELPKIGLEAGTYYVRVGRNLTFSNYWSDKPYNFTVNYTVASNWESEWNDKFETADTIAVGTNVNGSIMGSDDEDYYKFTLPQAGYVAVTFNHDLVDSTDELWSIRLYDAQYQELVYRTSTGKNIIRELPKIGLEAGTYYVRVGRNLTFSNYWSDKPYNFTVNYTVASNWESEWNDKFETADTIAVGTNVNGSIMGSDDEDYYKFTLPQAGYVAVTFNHDLVDSTDELWSIRLYDAQYQELVYRASTGKNIIRELPKIGLEAGTYYVRVGRNLTFPNYWSDRPYNFTVNYTVANDWESEWNDKFETADLITVGTAVNGSTMEGDDKDYYRFKLNSSGTLAVEFNHEKLNTTGTCWTIRIYNSQYQEIATRVVAGNEGKVTVNVGKVSAGTYYIQVTSAYYYHDGKYSVKVVKGKPAKTSISKITSPSKKKVKVVWKKVSGVNGYEIYRATSKKGKYKKIATVKSGKTVSYTDKKLKSKKRYYYKVRAYKVSNGKKVYGDYSAVKSVKVK